MARRYPKHSRWLIDILKQIDPKTGCEVGVWRGHTSQALLETFPKLFLSMVDPYTPYKDVALMSDSTAMLASAMIEAKARTERFCDRRDFLIMPSSQGKLFFDDATFDFVFIDGDHSYEGAKADITDWRDKVKQGGILCGDDYKQTFNFGVQRAVGEAFGDRVHTDHERLWWVMM